MDIEYYKIRVPGHQDIPDRCYQTFSRVVNSFLRDNQQNSNALLKDNSCIKFSFS